MRTYADAARSERSRITVQVYLNDVGEGDGGETTFLADVPNGVLRDIRVVPRAGRVLLFEHHLLHEGAELARGRKYAIRTDVMYRDR